MHLFSKNSKNGVLFESKKNSKPPLDTERIQLLFSKYVLVLISECIDKKYKNDYCLSKTRSTINQKCRDAKEVWRQYKTIENYYQDKVCGVTCITDNSKNT